MSEPTVFQVDRLALRFTPKPWPLAIERRAEIDAYFERLKRDKPEVWNGRVLLMHHQVVRDGVFSGEFLETNYASFAAWTAWGRPPAGVRDCFSGAALLASDGAFLLGVMGEHTFHAGHIYFPCGTPDPADIAGGKVDLEFSVWRELKEETGLTAADVEAAPGWTTVLDGNLVAQLKLMRARRDAESLRRRILSYLARQAKPELADIRIVRGREDFNDAMPGYVTAFLGDYFDKG